VEKVEKQLKQSLNALEYLVRTNLFAPLTVWTRPPTTSSYKSPRAMGANHSKIFVVGRD